MTLTELVDYICTKSGMNSPEDQASARKFISKRYELIWNGYLWKDCLFGLDVAIDPSSNADHAEGIVLLPESVDRVVAVRTDVQSVRVHGIEDYYRVDPDQFLRTGAPTEFSILDPVWFTWRGFYGLKGAVDSSDVDTLGKLTWKDFNGERHVQSGKLSDMLGVVSALPFPKQLNALGETFTFSTGNYSYIGEIPVTITTPTGNSFTADKMIVYQGNGSWALSIGTELVITNTTLFGQWKGNPSFGFDPFTVTPVDSAVYPVSFTTRIEIESFFKGVTSNPVSLSPSLTNNIIGGIAEPLGDSLKAGDTRSPSHQRLRLFSIPNTTLTLHVLAKKKFEPITFDQEEPAIRNLDNCLIAFAMADMLEMGRQYAKAQAMMSEGGVLLSELAKLETMQAANNTRFIPENGMGEGNYFGPRGGGIW
jgi:hypothetical protein